MQLEFVREPNNPYDNKATVVFVNGKQLSYVERDVAKMYYIQLVLYIPLGVS